MEITNDRVIIYKSKSREHKLTYMLLIESYGYAAEIMPTSTSIAPQNYLSNTEVHLITTKHLLQYLRRTFE